jgi:hypothetical protein
MKYIILLILFLPFIGYSQGFQKKDTLDGTEKLFLFAEPSGNKYVTTQAIADLATGSEAVTGFADAAFLNNYKQDE